jgi:hypothetical protein
MISGSLKKDDIIEYYLAATFIKAVVVEVEMPFIKVFNKQQDCIEILNINNIPVIRIFKKEDIKKPSLEKEKPKNPLVERALSLAELRFEKLKEDRALIKDTLTKKELKPKGEYYEMPSFKKHT